MLDLILRQASESEPGFARKTVKWAISVTSDGRYTGVVALADGKGRTFDACPSLSQPELIGGSETRSHFLCDSLAVLALWLERMRDETSIQYMQRCREHLKRNIDKHSYSVHLLSNASQAAPYLSAAHSVLTSKHELRAVRKHLRENRAKATDIAVVVIDQLNPLEQDDWRDWWRRFRASLHPPATGKKNRMRCIVTADVIELDLTRLHGRFPAWNSSQLSKRWRRVIHRRRGACHALADGG